MLVFTNWELWDNPFALAWVGMTLDRLYGPMRDPKGAAVISQ